MENASNLSSNIAKLSMGMGGYGLSCLRMPYCQHVSNFIIYPVLPFYYNCAYEYIRTMMNLSSMSQSMRYCGSNLTIVYLGLTFCHLLKDKHSIQNVE